MRTEEITDGSRLSAATRFELLVGVLNAIGTYRDPQELFGALVTAAQKQRGGVHLRLCSRSRLRSRGMIAAPLFSGSG